MAIHPLPDQARNLTTLKRQLQDGEVLLVGFNEGSRPHGGRVLRRLTEPELTRCIRAAGNRSITFYGMPRTGLLEHHRLGWQ